MIHTNEVARQNNIIVIFLPLVALLLFSFFTYIPFIQPGSPISCQSFEESGALHQNMKFFYQNRIYVFADMYVFVLQVEERNRNKPKCIFSSNKGEATANTTISLIWLWWLSRSKKAWWKRIKTPRSLILNNLFSIFLLYWYLEQ